MKLMVQNSVCHRQFSMKSEAGGGRKGAFTGPFGLDDGCEKNQETVEQWVPSSFMESYLIKRAALIAVHIM